MNAAAFESSGPGGKLHWSERRDGHWHAEAPGGHFDVVPMRHGYHLWFRARGSYIDLGHHQSLGGAFAGAIYTFTTVSGGGATLFVGSLDGTGFQLNGSIGHVAYYTTALSAARVSAHYTARG